MRPYVPHPLCPHSCLRKKYIGITCNQFILFEDDGRPAAGRGDIIEDASNGLSSPPAGGEGYSVDLLHRKSIMETHSIMMLMPRPPERLITVKFWNTFQKTPNKSRDSLNAYSKRLFEKGGRTVPTVRQSAKQFQHASKNRCKNAKHISGTEEK